MTGRRRVLPHDIVAVEDVTELTDPSGGPLEARAVAALAPAPWVVARRAPARAGAIAVGIRGRTRSDRFAALLSMSRVRRVVRPWELPETPPAGREELPAFRALAGIRRILAGLALPWGPGGSVAFELLTGTPCVGAGSDFDLLVAADAPLCDRDRIRIRRASERAEVRIDVQILVGSAGFSFAEWASAAGGPVALRTRSGPRITTDPWATP